MNHPIVNILYFNNFSTFNSGSPKSILGIAANIDKEKYNPIIAVSDKGPFFDESVKSSVKTVVLISCDFSLDNIFPFLVALFKNISFLLNENIDLVHLNYFGWRDSIVVAAKILRIKVISHVRNIHKGSFAGAWNASLSDKIIVVSEGTRLPFKKIPSIWNKSIVIYNAIDVDLFSGGHQIKSEFNIPEDHLVVGIIGQISQRKGVGIFLEMAAVVLKQFGNITFLIVGEEPKNDPGYMGKMMAFAKKIKVEEKVVFAGFRKDVQNILKSLDVLAIPSLSEPFARVILEAMVVGIPVVGTNVDGIPEAVIHGETGFVVPVNDPNALAQAISTLLDNNELRHKMGQEARQISLKEYNMDVLADNIDRVYSDLLN